MSTDKGYIKVYRDIRDHWIWKDKPFSRGQAWIDLIMLMNHEDKKFPFMGAPVLVKKGWSKMKVSRFLDVLEGDGMLIQKRDSKKTLITLINYGDYQDLTNKRGTVKGHRKDSEKTLTGNKKDADRNKQDIIEDTKEDIKKKEGESTFDPDDYVYDFATTDVDDDDW